MRCDLSDKELRAARERGWRRALSEPRAVTARFNPRTGATTIRLNNDCEFRFPTRALQGLAKATNADLSKVEVSVLGYGVHWPTLDADFTVLGLLNNRFGTARWMARGRRTRVK